MGLGNVTQCQNACLAWTTPHIGFPSTEEKKEEGSEIKQGGGEVKGRRREKSTAVDIQTEAEGAEDQ